MAHLYQSITRPGGSFACANSGAGFVSFLKEQLNPLDRLYILKGGPGTGKSHLMKELGKEAEKRSLNVDYIYCSSDPESLDAIIIPALSVAIADGTAPHLLEPLFPGAKEEFVSLGNYWNSSFLRTQKKEIQLLVHEKKAYYEKAFSCLSAAKIFFENAYALSVPHILEKELERFAEKQLKNLKIGEGYQKTVQFRSAISMKGCVRFSYPKEQAEKIFYLAPYYLTEYRFLELLESIFRRLEKQYICFKDPLSLRTEALFLQKERALFVIETPLANQKLSINEKLISLRRFRTKPEEKEKQRIHSLLQNKDRALLSALDLLNEAKIRHFRLEEIYHASMDFQRADGEKDRLISEIFS